MAKTKIKTNMKSKAGGVENKAYMQGILEIRRSNASGVHKTKGQKSTRAVKKRDAINRSLSEC